MAQRNNNGLPLVEGARTLDGGSVVRVTHRGGHFYISSGRVLPSPTTVLRAVMSKEAVGWAYASQERERAVRAAARVYARGQGLSQDQFEAAVWEELKSSKPPSAKTLGLEVHGHVFGSLRRALYGEQVELPQLSPDAVRIVDSIRGWWRQSVARPLHAERVVVGDGWAGTLDTVVEMHGGRGLSLLDLKVTRAQEPVTEWLCQVSAYSHAAERYGVRATPVVLAVHPDTCEVRMWPVEDSGRWYRVFQRALSLYEELSRELEEVESAIRALQALRQPAGAA